MPVVLITGAARGLGEATARLFISKGWKVVLIDKDERILQRFESEQVFAYHCDVTDEPGLQNVRNDLRQKELTLDVLINNAGYFAFLPVTDCDARALEQIFSVNALAPFRLINLFREDLVKNRGRVLQVSSENVKLSGLFQPYPATKIALEALSMAARQELALLGVKLIIVQPGAIRTDLLNWKVPGSKIYQRFIDRFILNARKKMGKVADPDKVARKVWHAATTQRPAILYTVNHNRWLSLFSMLPGSVQERIILKMIRDKE